jgi:hypothetical protein
MIDPHRRPYGVRFLLFPAGIAKPAYATIRKSYYPTHKEARLLLGAGVLMFHDHVMNVAETSHALEKRRSRMASASVG